MAIGAASGKHGKPSRTKVSKQMPLRKAVPAKAPKQGGSKILAAVAKAFQRRG